MTNSSGSLHWLKARFPAWKDLVSIFGIVVFAVHAWSIWQYLFYLPSFLLKYDTGEIVAIFFYHLAFAFLESLLVCALLAGLTAVLPTGWLRAGFVHKAFLLVIAAIVASIVLQRSIIDGFLVVDQPWPQFIFGSALIGLPLVALLAVTSRLPRLQALWVHVVDRFSVMLFLFLPLDAIGMLTVTIRLLR